MDLRTKISSQVVTQSTFKNDPCGVEGCRATRYRWDIERGFAICRNGHEHPEIRMQVSAEDIFESTRGDRSTRKRERQVLERIQLSGSEAFELYLLCWQLVLRKQVAWLIKEKGLPGDLEGLMQNLWALRLNALSSRLRADEAGAYSESEGESRRTYSSQEFSATSEDESDGAGGRRSSGARKSIPTFENTSPRLVDTIAMCYLACFLLRLPINLADILGWIQNGDMVYYRAILVLPRDMRDRLPSQEQARFDPVVLLTPGVLQNAISTLFLGFQHEMNMKLPTLNYPVHMLRLMMDLRLPAHIYGAVKKLSSLAKLDFRYPATKKRQYRTIDYPEFQLLSLLVIAVKLLYPFNNKRRYPLKPDEPAAMIMDWETWVWTVQQETRDQRPNSSTGSHSQTDSTTAASSKLTYKDAMTLNETDMMSMPSSQIDAYLSFYASTFATNELRTRDKDTDFRQYLLDLFPLESPESQPPLSTSAPSTQSVPPPAPNQPLNTLHTVISALKPRRPISAEEASSSSKQVVLRPGDAYARYKVVSDLSGTAEVFYREVASVGGVELSSLVKGVYAAERRLEIWAEGERKRERGGGDEESSSDDEGRFDSNRPKGERRGKHVNTGKARET